MTLPSEEHIFQYPGQGRIEVICGSMFSGKTEELIRRLKRAEFAKQRGDFQACDRYPLFAG